MSKVSQDFPYFEHFLQAPFYLYLKNLPSNTFFLREYLPTIFFARVVQITGKIT